MIIMCTFNSAHNYQYNFCLKLKKAALAAFY